MRRCACSMGAVGAVVGPDMSTAGKRKGET
jgi:hypothetical protein